MNNLIEQLLSQLKQQNEIDNLNNKENDSMISDITLEVINENKLLFPTHNFKLNQSKANISLQMNKENLKTILHNIIQNACKYSKETSTVIITIDPAYISIQDE
jgi:signal transduction histidine kinase